MFDTPKISVVVPVYNAIKYLKQCLDSIVNQTLQEIEIICVDDGSSDGSYELLQEYAENDQRVRVLRQENSGAGAARNKGLEIAKGKYLSFLDADDYFAEDMLEVAYKNAEDRNAQIVVFRGERFDEVEKATYQMRFTIREKQLPESEIFSGEDAAHTIFTVFIGWAWDKLFLREYIEEENLKFQEIRTYNDAYFVFSALVHARRIYAIRDGVYIYHRVNSQTCLTDTRSKSWDCSLSAVHKIREGLTQSGKYEIFEQSYLNWAIVCLFKNLETLQEDAFVAFFERLKKDVIHDLGFLKHEREYYNRPEFFDRMKEIAEWSLDEYLKKEMFRYRRQFQYEYNLKVIYKDKNKKQKEMIKSLKSDVKMWKKEVNTPLKIQIKSKIKNKLFRNKQKS